MRFKIAIAAAMILACTPIVRAQTPAASPQAPDVVAIRAQLDALKAEYEKRIKALEDQLEEVQAKLLQMPEGETAAAPAAAAPTQTSIGAMNPAISVDGNFVGRIDNQKIFLQEGDRLDNRMLLREAEVDMRAPIDPYADGVLITSL